MEKEVKIRKVYFHNNKNQKLCGILYESNKDNMIIICHGVAANKNMNFIPLLSRGLSKNGFSVLRFDFTGNGESEGKFVEGTYTQEVSDLGKAIDFVVKRGYDKICVIGYSMGGAVSIIRAASDKRINSLISISGTAYPNKTIERVLPSTKSFFRHLLKRFEDINKEKKSFKHKRKKLKEIGTTLWRKKQLLKISFFRDSMNYDCTKYARKIRIPFLIIHGRNDDILPTQYAKDLYKNANKPKYLEIVEGADHFFGYESSYNKGRITKEYISMREKILQFLNNNLK